MERKLIKPSEELAVMLDEARLAARADGTTMDIEISRAVRALTTEVEHITQRAVVAQEWRLTLECFPQEIRLPRPPLLSVISIRYYDVDGVLQTLPPAAYAVDADCEPARIEPVPGIAWPATMKRRNAVQVQFRCGYGPDDGAVPDGIKFYILGRLAEQFAPGKERSPFLAGHLDQYMVYA